MKYETFQIIGRHNKTEYKIVFSIDKYILTLHIDVPPEYTTENSFSILSGFKYESNVVQYCLEQFNQMAILSNIPTMTKEELFSYSGHGTILVSNEILI